MAKPETVQEEAESKKPRFKYVRTGRCQPNKCGALCCRLGPLLNLVSKEDLAKPLKDKTEINPEFFGWYKFWENKTHVFYTTGRACNHLSGNRCNIQKDKPIGCRKFPEAWDQSWYEAVKKYCTYKFKKVRIR